MSWTGIPAGPGGPLAAARAARGGPPRSYELDGEIYEVLPDWWPLLDLMPTGGWRLPLVLDMTHPADAVTLRRRLHDRDDPLKGRDVERIAVGLVEAATARPWYVVEKLISFTAAHWAELEGRMPTVDLARVLATRPARALNLVHMTLVEGVESKERKKFDDSLYRPPAEAIAEAPQWSAEDEGNAFMAAMGQAGRAGALG